MEKKDITDELHKVEKHVGMLLPHEYKKFIIENVKDTDAYEFQRVNGEHFYVFNCIDLLERNLTYTIQDVEPDYLLIGQDGDLGYFINLRKGTDEIYSLDLGALGSFAMDKEGDSILML